jgi:hypothetical protein
MCSIGTSTNKLCVLCPPYSAPKKSGRPMAAKRIKGSIDMSLNKKKGKKGKKMPMEPEDEEIGKKKRGHSCVIKILMLLTDQQHEIVI